MTELILDSIFERDRLGTYRLSMVDDTPSWPGQRGVPGRSREIRYLVTPGLVNVPTSRMKSSAE